VPNLTKQIAAEISDDDDVNSGEVTPKSDIASASGAAVQSMRKQAE